MPFLTVHFAGDQLGQGEFSRPLNVGRSPDCGLTLPDPRVSRVHCRIAPTRDGWQLIDLASKNGTFVNGRPVTDLILSHGDEICLGATLLLFGDATPVTRAARPRAATPIEALELARAELPEPRLDEDETDHLRPRPMPYAWDAPANPATSDDSLSTITGLSFAKKLWRRIKSAKQKTHGV